MAVSFNGQPALVSTAATNTPSVTGTFPTGSSPAAGHLIVCVVSLYGSTSITSITPPAGYATAVTVTATTNLMAIYTKTATGSDSAPVFSGVVTGTAADADMTITVYDLSDSSGNTPVLDAHGSATGTTALPAVTTSTIIHAGGELAIAAAGIGQGTTAAANTWTTPSNWLPGPNQTASARSQTANYNTTTASVLSPGSTATVTMVKSRTTTETAAVIATFSAPAPLTPLSGPVGLRILMIRAGLATASVIPAVTVTPPPVIHAPLYPLQAPVTIRRLVPPRGRSYGNPGAPVHNPTHGPAVKPLAGPVQARQPLPFSKGRGTGNPGAPVRNLSQGPPVRPLTSPVQARFPAPPPGRAATMASLTVTFVSSGPPATPLTSPVRARQPLPRHGRAQGSQGAPPPAVTLAPLYPLQAPVQARHPLPPRGRTSGNPGAPVHNPSSGPAAKPLTAPVQARQPLSPHGRIYGNPGAPVRNPAPAPVSRALSQPVRTRIPQAFSKGRAGALSGAPVRNPTAGPPVRPLTAPVQARRPLPPHGRIQATPPPVTRMQCGPAPLYVFPGTVPWQLFLASPGPLPPLVILNNGNGDVAWSGVWETLTTSLHALGITVLGYVYTEFGTRPAATVEAAVGNYLGAGITPGGNGVDGIFLDQFQSGAGGFAYYSGICASIQSQFAAAGGSSPPPIWGNPGTYLDSSYLALPVEAFVTFEGDVLTYQNVTPYNVSVSGVPQSGASTWSRTRFAHLVYSVTRTEVDGVIDRAWANYAGWAYTTNWRGDTNPYGQIPGNDYLADEVLRAAAEPVIPAAGIPPWLYPLQAPAMARLPQLHPRAGRGYGNPGAPVRNPAPPAAARPLSQPARTRIPAPPPRGRAYGNTGAPAVHVGPPARPLTAPVRAPVPAAFSRGRRYGNPGTGPVHAGPALRPLTAPVAARQPLPRPGRVSGSPGAPVRNPSTGTGPPLYPLRQPARTRITLPPRGRTSGNPGAPVHNPVTGQGPPFYPQGTIRFRVTRPPRGRAYGSKGAPVTHAGPPVTPLQGPARGRLPQLHPRAGRVYGNPGTPPVHAGPPATPLTTPVRAPVPAAFSKGRAYGSKGAPVNNPVIRIPVLNKALRAQPPVFLKGRIAGNPGAPVRNPTQGPQFRQATSPARFRITLPPRGRVYGNPGAPVQNPVEGPVPPGTLYLTPATITQGRPYAATTIAGAVPGVLTISNAAGAVTAITVPAGVLTISNARDAELTISSAAGPGPVVSHAVTTVLVAGPPSAGSGQITTPPDSAIPSPDPVVVPAYVQR